MKKTISLFCFAALIPLSATAQLAPPNAAGVSLGHFHTIVRDVDASRKFWTTLGGQAMKIDGTDVVKMPGVFVFITKGNPSAGSYGSVVNHVTFLAVDQDAEVARWKAAGLSAEAVHSEYGHNPIAWAYTPDDLKIRFNPDKSLKTPIGSPGIQLWVTESKVPEMVAWYSATFGGEKGGSINNGFGVTGIGGTRVAITASGEQPPARTARGIGFIHGAFPDQAFIDRLAKTNLSLPTKGRTLDHIGFEVTNLEAFCKKLQASGVKFDEPFSTTRHKDFATARFTDPWGVSIELTEGLRKF